MRTPDELLKELGLIAHKNNISRSALIKLAVESFVSILETRGYLIPPYEENEMLSNLQLSKKRKRTRD